MGQRGKVAKKQRSKSSGRRITAKVVRRRKAFTVDPTERIALLTRERDEALEQQTATSEVLKVLSRSMFDLQPVLDTLVEKAVRLSGADRGFIFRQDGDVYRVVASFGHSKEFIEIAKQNPIRRDRGSATGRAILERGTVHIHDIQADPEYRWAEDHSGEEEMHRTILAVPMLRESEIMGVIVIRRIRVQPFTEKQIELVTNFATQAVIAIENTRLLTELRESLQQQTATADVLKVISRSAFDLQAVLDTLTESAALLCEADMGAITRQGGDGRFYHATNYNFGPDWVEFASRWAIQPGRGSVGGRVLQQRAPVQVADVFADPEYTFLDPAKKAGYRTLLGVPLLREGNPIGVITLGRKRVAPFTDKQVELVSTFADQAVIAIENVRLFEAEQQRTRELSESLEQQMATSEILRAISSSPGELEPVFQAILTNTLRLCGAGFGNLLLFDGKDMRVVAMHNAPPEFVELRRKNPVIPLEKSILGPLVRTKQVSHVADITVEEPYASSPLAKTGHARTAVGIPITRDGLLIGAIGIYLQEVRPFTDKQIELLENFAAQAVIAIENTRLLNELRESLAQQTATSEVLQVISSSPGDLERVFQSMLANATRICEAKFGLLLRFDGEMFRFAAEVGTPPALTEFVRRRGPFQPVAGSHLDHVMRKKRVSHTVDYATEGILSPPVTLGGARSTVDVPLLKDNVLIGAFSIYRQEVRPFTDKQIALLINFAAQAVIAIENSRLLNELRESLQQQTATSELLNVISRSKFDLQPILQSVVDTAAPLCRADTAVIFRLDEGKYRFATGYCVDPKYIEIERANPITPGPGTVVGRAAIRRAAVQIVDAMDDPLYDRKQDAEIGQVRSMIGVPLMREGEPIGVIALARRRVEPFRDREIELVSTFADQAAIAIENVRLFESVEARTRELAKSLEDLRAAQDRLVQTEKLASLGQLTAGIAHEIKNPLNFVNNFSSVSVELIGELRQLLAGAKLDNEIRVEISEIADTLQGNLDKVAQHGKRADSIVKNMLLHSRQGSGEQRPVDINSLVEESLNLAYHGARAEKQNFNINLEMSLDPSAGEAELFPQEITRVLLNLFSNGFYAAKRKSETNEPGFEPTLVATTKDLGDRVEIRIRDNGTGIPPEVKKKIFNPFFTTKPAGEGTGLGLSISHDVIVKQHGGSIEVDTKPGEFAEFKITLPRTAATIAKPGDRS